LEREVTTPEEFATLIRRDDASYGRLIRATGLKMD
jgi:tripartite-type tricarboxylate transporter receptor subunit TctC